MKLSALFKANIYGDVIAFLSGVILPFAFAPFSFYPLGIFSPTLLLASWLFISPRRVFLRGWLFGLGFFGIGISWIYISMHVYGYAPIPFAALATILFVAAFSLFPALQGYLWAKLLPNNNLSKILLAFPASWVIIEWIRSWLLTGFPWLLLGYSQINSILHGFAPLIGTYGLSLTVTFISAAIVAIFYFKNLGWRISLVSLIIVIGLSAALLTKVRWTQPNPEKIKVTLIQGDIAQQMKWQVAQIEKTLSLYYELTAQHWDSNIIIWPEAAITITNLDAQNYLDELTIAAKKHNTAIITGIPIFSDNQYYNGVMVLGNGQGTYLKRHLVPLGEYVPLRSFFTIFKQFVQIPMSDMSRGPKVQAPLTVNGIKIAAFICYEIAFPAEVLDSLPEAQLLVVVSDDSWFGESIAAAQQLEMTQMRALETGRYVLSATNNGITAIIDPQGKLQAIAAPYQQAVLTGSVQAMTGATPLVKWGIYPSILISFILFGIALQRRRKR